MKTRFFLPLALAATIFTAQPVLAQDVNDLFQQGSAAQAAGNFPVAEQAFRRAITLEPNNAAAYNNLGNALRRQGKLEEAIASYRTALRIDPNLADAYNGLGNAFYVQRNFTEAITNYQTTLRLDSSYSDAYNGLGNVFGQQGNLPEAIANYRTALRFEPNNPDFLSNLREAERLLAAGGNSPAVTGTNILRESGVLGINSQVLASDGTFFNTHTFNGRVGQVVEINLVSSEFDTYLALLSPNGQSLGQNDDVSPGNTNSFLRVTLPSMGTYTIVVNGLEKTSRGRYNLSVTAP